MRVPMLPGLLAAGVVACGSGSTSPSAPITRIVVSPDTTSIPASNTVMLTAQAQSASGHPVSGVTMFWSTNDTLIATVSQNGLVTALANGVARIAASADNLSGYAVVIVQPLTVASVTLSPALDTIYATAPHNAVTLTATTRDAAGAVLTGQPLIWSATGGVANVANGVVTATNTAAGTATVTATSSAPGLPSGSATVVVIGHAHSVSVSPATTNLSVSGVFIPTTVQLSATIIDTFGANVSSSRSVTWTSSAPSVATVSKTGLVTAVQSSTTSVTITATTTDGVSGHASVTVLP
jgi:trimeric autotransporter adhesin